MTPPYSQRLAVLLPQGAYLPPGGEGGFGIGQTWAIPKTDEGKMSQIFAWFPLISQRLVPRRCQLPPKGKLWHLRRGSKKRTQSIRIFIRPVCAHLEIFSGYLILFWAAAGHSPDGKHPNLFIAATSLLWYVLTDYHIKKKMSIFFAE